MFDKHCRRDILLDQPTWLKLKKITEPRGYHVVQSKKNSRGKAQLL